MDIDKQVEKRIKAVGLEVSDLTEDELKRLREQIAKERRGICTLDGVLSDPSITFRVLKKKREASNH